MTYIALQLLFFYTYFTLMYRPLEVVHPARRGQPVLRPAWFTDLCFFVGQYAIWTGVVFSVLLLEREWIEGIAPAHLRETVAAQPWWLQAVGIVLMGDFMTYWGHRLEHRVDLLWSFHSVHHTARHLDWLAAHREHPLDTIWTVTIESFTAYVVGFPFETISAFITFRGLWAIFIHSNVRVPLGPLGILLGSPELHHWHHARDRDAGNYGNLSPLMDILFGTYYCPGREPESLGITDPHSSSYIGLLLHPLKWLVRRRHRLAVLPERRRTDRALTTPSVPAMAPSIVTVTVVAPEARATVNVNVAEAPAAMDAGLSPGRHDVLEGDVDARRITESAA